MLLILQDHIMHCKSTMQKARIAVDKLNDEKLSALLESMPAAQKRTLSRITRGESSGWLTVLPLASQRFDQGFVGSQSFPWLLKGLTRVFSSY